MPSSAESLTQNAPRSTAPAAPHWEVPPGIALLARQNGAVLRELVELFLADGEQNLQMLTIAAENGDCRALARCSHSLKGSAQTMGAIPMIELCHHIEQSARSSAQRDYRADVRRLAEAFHDTRAAMLACGGTASLEPERRIDGAG